ncbi:MAG: DNA replication/repair protein RecF [Alphaproteobacteria bacterium]|nr:DNA replication/repair protein RecF [Alphaproteobacteria bacterium]MCB9794542.1 DNA replication/repair protein RecF [Alphaproteobacteria bacterium]
MRLLELAARDFRNLEEVQVPTDAPFVVFHGENAQGKTNLLEAVYALATLKSFRARRNRELIRFGTQTAVVSGRVDDGESTRRFRFEVGDKGRSATVDGKAPEALGDYFRGIRAVLFTPEDISIVRGGPDERRRFMDRAAFTANPAFLELAREHRRLLSQKGALLREERPDRLQVSVFNEQLCLAGARLSAWRARIVGELIEPFKELHGRIAGEGSAALKYRSRLGEGDVEARAEAYRILLAEQLPEELRRGFNLDGPQRDDLGLQVGGRPARTYGSQGQVRSVVLALKLSELLAARARGDRPLFLLDDLSSELDRLRTGRLVALLSELSVQCLVTTTDPGAILARAGGDALLHRVSGGSISSGSESPRTPGAPTPSTG